MLLVFTIQNMSLGTIQRYYEAKIKKGGKIMIPCFVSSNVIG